MPMAGKSLTRPNGSANEIVSVDWSGLKRRSSSGKLQMIDMEIFRWSIERMIDGDVVLRSEINDHYQKRASSGILLVLGSLPMFETTKVGPKLGVRLRSPS